MHFGDRLKQIRRERRLSQSELGDLLGTSKQVISRYETGLRCPKISVVRGFAEKLGISAAELMGDEEAEASQVNLRPRLGTIACGEPILAQEHILAYDPVPENIHCDFTLVCKGDSMTGARILDGDVVYIRAQKTVENGQIAAVRIQDSATLKRVYYTDQGLLLQPENPAYAPMLFSGTELADVEVIGLAVGFTSLKI